MVFEIPSSYAVHGGYIAVFANLSVESHVVVNPSDDNVPLKAVADIHAAIIVDDPVNTLLRLFLRY